MRTDRIEVNHPLRIEGDRIYLIGHGFARRVTVRLPDGEKYALTAAFIPTDPTTFSARERSSSPVRRPRTARTPRTSAWTGSSPRRRRRRPRASTPRSRRRPRTRCSGCTVYRGDLGLTGGPQSVYSLDQDQITSGKLKQIGAVNLTQGQTKSFAGGVTVTFDGWRPWASMQVSHDPAQGYLLVAAVGMVVGLIGSLGVRRRRVWVRLAPASSPTESGAVASNRTYAKLDAGQPG